MLTFIDTEQRLLVTRGGKWMVSEEGQKVQNYKINYSWGYNVQYMIIVNNPVLYI